MALFTIETSSSSASFGRSSLIDLASSNFSNRQDTNHRQNFIKFLQYATALQVNILPLKWESNLGTVGSDGATGRVNQSLLNANMTFAYKRFKPDVTNRQLSESQFRDLQYSAMINEMVILSQSPTRGHDNFPRLVGVCLEHSPDGTEFWPMLILLKADQGDLGAYILQKKILDPQLSLKICGEIANDIHVAHQYGIVHGDINPRNILIWQDYQTGGMAVLLADFGFSKFGASDDLVQLYRSEPWDAPEWHHNYFRLEDAKKTDIYSFGLVCLWMFFSNEILSEIGLPSTTIGDAFMGIDRNAVSEVQSKKLDGDSILQLALHLLDQKTDLQEEIQSRLRTVFSLALARDPNRRPASMEIFVKTLLGSFKDVVNVDSPAVVTAPDWHESLDFTDFLFQLDFCDYRVHSFAVQALIHMVNDEGCDSCRRGAVFQLSLSSSIKFGTCTSHVAEDKLHQFNQTIVDLVSTFDRLKTSRLNSKFLEDLAKLGYRYELPSYYSSEGVLDNALDYWRHGVVAREKAIGLNHFLTLRAKHILVLLLLKSGQIEEAWEVIMALTKLENLSLTDRVEFNTIISLLLMEFGNNVQAEAMIRQLLEWYADKPERDHTERLDHQQDLVKLLLQRGEREEALELALKTVGECLKELGSNHSITYRAKRCLAASYDALGLFQMGIQVNEDLTRQNQQALNEELKPALIQDIARLGIQYYFSGQEDAAQKCYGRIQNAIKQSNEMAVHAVNAANNFATRLLNCGDFERASIILEALLQESLRILGVESQETALVMGNLAHVYSSQRQWDKAETLEKQVIQIRRRILGENHRDTVTAMGGLRHILLAQKRYKEAANAAWEEYTSFHNASREEKINAAETIARALESAGAFAEAIPFFEEELALKTAKGEFLPSAVVSTMMLAAICHIELGQLSQARNIMDEATLRVRDAKEFNVDGTTIAADIIRLDSVVREKDFTIEAEELLSVSAGRLQESLKNGNLGPQFEPGIVEIATRASRLQI